MEYVVLIATDPSVWDRSTPEERRTFFDAHTDFERSVAEKGRKMSGAALADAETATTIRHTDGRVSLTDGPFVELTEQVAGLYLVDLPNLDAAIEAASLLPASYTVEIRPVVDIDDDEPPVALDHAPARATVAGGQASRALSASIASAALAASPPLSFSSARARVSACASFSVVRMALAIGMP